MPVQKRIATFGLVLILVSFWTMLTVPLFQMALQRDFLGIYVGASLAWQGQYERMYDPEVLRETQLRISPGQPYLNVFNRTPFFAAVFSPLAALPLRQAFAVWVALQAVLLLACSLWAWRKWGDDALVWSALSLPAFLAIGHGQDTSLLLAIFVAGYALAERKRDFAAGVVWALALYKFNLVLALPLAMLAARRWRMLAGFSTAGGVLAAWSVGLLGWVGVGRYVRLLRNNDLPGLNPSPELMMNIEGITSNLGLGVPGMAAGGVLVLALGYCAIRNAPLWRWAAATFITCLLAVPHVYAYNGAALLLVVWLAYFHSASKWTRSAAALYAVPLLYALRFVSDAGAMAIPVCLLFLLGALAAENFEFAWRTSTANSVRESPGTAADWRAAPRQG